MGRPAGDGEAWRFHSNLASSLTGYFYRYWHLAIVVYIGLAEIKIQPAISGC
jgi:hypothetical protein